MWAGSDPRPIGSRHAVAPSPPSITRDDVMDGRPISSQIVMPYRILGNTGLQSYKCGQTNYAFQNGLPMIRMRSVSLIGDIGVYRRS